MIKNVKDTESAILRYDDCDYITGIFITKYNVIREAYEFRRTFTVFIVTHERKKIPIYWRSEQRTNRVSGVGMATGFERGVCRLIDAGSKPINWSNSSPFDGRGGRISGFLPLRTRVRLSSNGLAMLEISYTRRISIFPVGNPEFLKDNIKGHYRAHLRVWLRKNARGHICIYMYVHNRKLRIANLRRGRISRYRMIFNI